MKLIKTFCFGAILFLSSCQKHVPTEYENVKDPKSDQYIPNPPSAFKILSISLTGIKLSWSDESVGETGFVVERSTANLNNFIPICTSLPNLTQYTDTLNLKAEEKYYYRVKAIAGKNSSAYSSVISTPYNLLSPKLEFERVSDYSINLKWEENNESIQGYNLYISEFPSDSYQLLAIVMNPKTNYLIENLDRNKVYEFWMEAFISFNKTPPSNHLKLIYGILPTLIQILPTSNGQIDFSPVNNDLVVSGGGVDNVKIWDPIHGVVKKNLGFKSSYVKYNPTGTKLGIANALQSLSTGSEQTYILDVVTNQVVDTLKVDAEKIDFASSGNKLVSSMLTALDKNNIIVYDLQNHKELVRSESGFRRNAKFEKNEDKIICIYDHGSNNIVMILDGKTTNLLEQIDPEGYRITDYALSDDGKYLAFSATTADYLIAGTEAEIWDLNSLQLVKKLVSNQHYGVYALAFSQNGKFFAVGGTLELYRTFDYKMICQIPNLGGSYRIVSMDFNNDGTYLAVATERGNTEIIALQQAWVEYLQ